MNNPQDWVTKSPQVTISQEINVVKSTESNEQLFEKWFITPLRKMGRHDGFILLYSLFPLYERHLNLIVPNLDRFTKGHLVFSRIGEDLLLSMDEAFHFWQIFRNGGLHSAFPDEEYKLPYHFILQFHDENPVLFENNIFKVNPLALRDKILRIINHNRMWEDNNFPEVVQILGT